MHSNSRTRRQSLFPPFKLQTLSNEKLAYVIPRVGNAIILCSSEVSKGKSSKTHPEAGARWALFSLLFVIGSSELIYQENMNKIDEQHTGSFLVGIRLCNLRAKLMNTIPRIVISCVFLSSDHLLGME